MGEPSSRGTTSEAMAFLSGYVGPKSRRAKSAPATLSICRVGGSALISQAGMCFGHDLERESTMNAAQNRVRPTASLWIRDNLHGRLLEFRIFIETLSAETSTSVEDLRSCPGSPLGPSSLSADRDLASSRWSINPSNRSWREVGATRFAPASPFGSTGRVSTEHGLETPSGNP